MTYAQPGLSWITRFMVHFFSLYRRGMSKCRAHLFPILLAASSVMFVYAIVQDYATRNYLRGFSDAIVPASGAPENKAESLLAWMKHPPNSRSLDGRDFRLLDNRDPLDTLNNQRTLKICGTAVNAFINLARLAGLEVRPLILLGKNYGATHVVAELYVPQRWVVVDPTFRRIMRDARGRALTRTELQDSRLLGEATVGLKNYLPVYTYERTTHIRLEKIPYVGTHVRKALNALYPQWEDAIPFNWILDRRSTLRTLIAAVILCLSSLAYFVNWRRATQNFRRASAKRVTQARKENWALPGKSADSLS